MMWIYTSCVYDMYGMCYEYEYDLYRLVDKDINKWDVDYGFHPFDFFFTQKVV